MPAQSNTATRRGLVAALFAERLQAQKAINDLKDAGFPPDTIGLALRDQDAQAQLQAETGTHAAGGASVGVATGGVLGGLTGLLIGMGALVIPGIGPVVAGGVLASALGAAGVTAAAGAGLGAATGGIVGALVGAGVPETEAQRFHEGFSRGAVLVTVHADGAERRAEAERILSGYGGDLGRDGATSGTVSRTGTTVPAPTSSSTLAVDPDAAAEAMPPTGATVADTTHGDSHYRNRDEDTGSRMTI